METVKQVEICQHVLEGSKPELLIIENKQLQFAVCFGCADRIEAAQGNVEGIVGVATGRHIPALVDAMDAAAMGDGAFQLLDGMYTRQPDDVVA